MGYTVLLSNTVNSDNTTNMEHMINENKQDVGVMISHNDFYVVVCRKYEGDQTITYVTCPFPSCKLGFVDRLDKDLKSRKLDGVLEYRSDDKLDIITIDIEGKDLRKLVYVVEWSLYSISCLNRDEMTVPRKKLARQFLLATQHHWMTLEKYNLINSIQDEQP
uniref:hypothetical protein n=1 Tax=Prevotella sp. TaxID=59823 RepID=UPI003FEEA2FE